MEKISKEYKSIVKRISHTRDLMYLTEFLWGVLLAFSSTLLTILIFSIIEYYGSFPSEARLFFFALFWLAFIVPLGLWSLSPFLKMLGLRHTIHIDELAFRIGNYYEDLKDKLSNSIQIMNRIENSNGISNQLALASFQQIFEISKNKNFNVVVETKKLLNIFLVFLASLGLFWGGYTFLNKQVSTGFYRIKNWQMSFIPPAPFKLTVNPKYAKILINTDLKVQIKAEGVAPETIKLNVREGNSKDFDNFTLRLDTGNTYNFTFTNLKNSIEFYAEAEWLNTTVISSLGKIEVYERPYIRSISGTLTYPSYTKLEPRTFSEQNGDITALKGSVVLLNIAASKELSKGAIYLIKDLEQKTEKNAETLPKTDTTLIPLKVNKNVASGSFKITTSGTYYVSITDKNNETSENPVQYGIVALNDESPQIKLLQPSFDVKLSEDAVLPIRVNITDDFGFSSLRLYYKLTYSKYSSPDKDYKKVDMPIIYDGLNVEIPYIWNLKNLDIVPEDRYEFYVEVADNDIISGPKKARTELITVVLPSLEEVLQQSENTQESIEKEMQDALQDTKELQKEMEKFARDLKSENRATMTWEEQKKAKELLQKQNEISKRMENLEKQLSQNTENLKKNNLLSEETMQKYMELQKLMKEINSPELRKLQQMMEQAAQKLSKTELEQALKNMKFSEEQFRKSIERTMKVLQRLQLEQKIDALNRQAEKMQEQQEKLQQELNKTSPDAKDKIDQLQKKQNELKSQTKAIDKDLQELEKLMQKVDAENMPLSELKEAQQALNSKETESEMQDANDAMEQGNFNKASQQMQKANKNLSNFKQKMQKLKQEMDKRSSEEAIRQMEKAIKDMLELSKNQENLLNTTKSTDYNSTNLPNLGREQANQFQALMRLAERLADLSERSFAVTPEMGELISSALQNMNEAMENFTDRKLPSITSAQSQALEKMNTAVAQMQEMAQTMKKSNGSCPNPGGSGQPNSIGNGSGLSQRLQQLAAQQQAINQMMQQMMSGNGSPSSGMSQEQQAQYQRIMQNQQDAQKTMQQLQEEAKQYGNTPEGKRMKNELDNLQKELNNVAKDFQQNGPRPENIKKQEQILAKLLDLFNSQNEKEFDNRRESREGKQFDLKSPDSIDYLKQSMQNVTLEQLLKNSGKQYTIDYQNLIKQYFDNINKQKVQ
ncbi:MAG: DUF4175 family protein [Candidatus Kapaibacteriota bacterium]